MAKKEAHETIGEFIGNKFTDKIVKPKPLPESSSRNVKEIIFPPKQGEYILNELRKVL